MRKAPKVSVVSISYNQEKYISQTLEGFVMQQADFDIEVIIGDDCSTDGTAKTIKQYSDAHPKLFKPILRKENVGIAENLYSVLRAARGQYVAICEGDDYWTDPQKLQKQADFLDKNLDYGLCFHPVRVLVEDDSEEDYISPDPAEKDSFTAEELLRRNFIQTNSVLYRRQSYDDMPYNIMPMDWYLHMYHAQFGKIGFINETMSVYRRHAGGLWSDSYEEVEKILLKHGVSWLGVHMAALKIYENNPEYRKIITGSIITMFNRLSEVDKKHDSTLIQAAIKEFPNGGELYIQDLLKQARMLDKHSKEQAKIIEHYTVLAKDLEAEKHGIETQNHQLQAKLLVRLEGAVKRRIGKSHD